MPRIAALLFFIPLLAVSGCDSGPESGWGFTLPAGDATAGAETFVELQCTGCHTIRANATFTQPEGAQLNVPLGGPVTRIQTYGELVSSIINPSHRIAPGFREIGVTEEGESKMRVYNEVMTVEQLCNLVAFLQAQYQLLPYDRTHYGTYL